MFFLRLIRLLVYSNVFIAICAVGLQCFCWPTTTYCASALLFFAVLAAYSVLKLVGNKNHALQPDFTAIGWLQQNTSMQYVIAIAAFTGVLFCWYKLQFVLHLSWGIAVVLLLFYIYFRKVHVLSMLPRVFQAFMKIGIVAAVWTFVLLPFDGGTSLPLLSIYLFFFILALMIPFEIRDMQHDAPFQVPTLPLLFGEGKAKLISYLLLIVSFLFYWMIDSGGVERCAVGLTTLIGVALVRETSPTRSDLFFLVGIDGLLIFPLLITPFLHELIYFYHTFF